MKKLFALMAFTGMLLFIASNAVVAQDNTAMQDTSTVQEEQVDMTADPVEEAAAVAEEGKSLHSQLKQKFIEGGPTFMSFVLIALILGLAFAIEKGIVPESCNKQHQKTVGECRTST